eukprot:511004-Pelagomonas_calceolata.AAC.1
MAMIRFNRSTYWKTSSTGGRCPLCDDMDSINHVVLRCPNPTMSGMHINGPHVGLSFCVKALGKGRFGSSLFGMDACRNERLLDQGVQVPENISRAIPDWAFRKRKEKSTQARGRVH